MLLSADVQIRLSVPDAVLVGQPFVLKGFVTDLRTPASGVAIAHVDVPYNSALASAVAGTIVHGAQYSETDSTSGDLNTAGLINDVGGTSKNLEAPSDPAAEYLLFSVQMTATAVGECSFTPQSSGNTLWPISTFPGLVALTSDQITFIGDSTTVVDPAKISGITYVDVNTNGKFDSGVDAKFGPMQITLTGTDVNGVAVNQTTTSAAGGTYSFTGLLPSDAAGYTLTEATTTAYSQGTATAGSPANGTVAGDVISHIGVTAGASLTGYDFGEIAGSIRGTVFVDVDNNGQYQSGTDKPVSGVLLTLGGTDINGSPVFKMANSAADGTYSFSSLAASNAAGYTITEGDVSGYAQGVATPGDPVNGAIDGTDVIKQINLAGGANLAGYNFSELAGSIKGVVYTDVNNDGQYTSGTDKPLGGIVVTLTGTDATGAAVNKPATSAADGTYSFIGLAAANASGYTLTEAATPGYAQGTNTAGSPVSGTIALDVISQIGLTAGANRTSYNFGELGGSIQGVVYLDINTNGQYNSGTDSPLGSVQITLTGTDANGTVVNSTATSAADGTYSFTGLAAANASGYTLTEAATPGYAQGTNTAGSPGSGTVTLDVISHISLAAAASLAGYNFGELAGSVQGVVYSDVNNNGQRDTGEATLSGTPVTLSGIDANGSTVSKTTTSGSNGAYSFTALAISGTAGYTLSPSGKTVHVTAAAQTVDLAVSTGSLGGIVYLDINENHQYDSGTDTALAGVVITLTGTDAAGTAVNKTATSATNGTYSFTGLASANSAGYTLTEAATPAYTQGTNTAGSPVSGTVAADVISGISYSLGANLTGYNFGEVGGSLGGIVYVDVNSNGKYDTGDTPLSGIQITLAGADLNNKAMSKRVNSAADGTYSLTGIPASDSSGYILSEAATSAYGQGTNTAGNPVRGGVFGDAVSGITFAVGAKLVGYDFGEIGGRVSGLIYADVNANGAYNSGTDTPKSGVQVTLTGTDVNGAAVSRTTTSGSDGTYVIASLPGGTYSIALVPAPLPAQEWPVNPLQLSAGAQLTKNFGEVASSLRGVVYLDINNNGQYDSGTDSPLGGVTLTLTGTDSSGTAVSKTATSSTTDGSYSFSGLASSNSSGYTITESTTPVYSEGAITPGTPTNGATSGNSITGIQFVVDSSLAGYNFGEIPSRVSGRLYTDVDNNGHYDSGTDTVIWDVVVTLSGTDSGGAAVTKTTTSGTDGTYSITGVPAGTYTLTTAYIGVAANEWPSSQIQVSAAAQMTSVNFGYKVVTSSLTGTVYVDLNKNSQYDAGTDTPLTGVVVSLIGTDGSGAAVSQTATSGTDGTYSFTSLPASNGTGYTLTKASTPAYAVGTSTPGTTANGTASGNTISGIGFAASSNLAGYNFGAIPGSLAGVVYVDVNANGQYNSGTDTPLSGVVVTLTGNDITGTPVSKTATSAADGTYSFTGLMASGSGGYVLTEASTPAYGQGTNTPGSTANGTVSGDVISQISIAAGGTVTGYTFGETLATVKGVVYLDVNNNGQYDSGTDTGIAGVQLTLAGSDINGATVSKTATSGSDGTYTFTGLLTSSTAGYTLTEASTPTYGQGTNTPGSPTNGTVSGDVISQIHVATGATVSGYNFGENITSVKGVVYLDVNNNGQYDSGTDTGVAGVQLTLAGSDINGATVSKTATTGSDGTYTFTGLLASSTAGYTLTEASTPIYSQGTNTPGSPTNGTVSGDVISQIHVATGATVSGYNFGEVAVSLKGVVYVDANANGSQDTGEAGIANVVITLTGADAAGTAVSKTATTGSDGTYSFLTLPISNSTGYTLTETQPTGYPQGTNSVGTVGGTAKGTLGPSTDQISQVVLAAGNAGITYNFGELPLPPASSGLSGFVYLDNNNDGSYSTTNGKYHVGVAGVTLTLTGTDGTGAAVSQVAITSANGSYSFDNLQAGKYTLTETPPAKLRDGKNTVGTIDGTASGTVATSQLVDIVLGQGAVGLNYNFGHRGIESSAVSLRLFMASTPPMAQVVTQFRSAPVVALNGSQSTNYASSFTTGTATPVVNTTAATVTQTSGGALVSLKVTITNAKNGSSETLTADTSVLGTAPKITSSYAGGVLTLSGVDSLANYQKVLRTIKYNNTATSPDTTQRIITFSAYDSLENSNTATTTLTFGTANASATDAALLSSYT